MQIKYLFWVLAFVFAGCVKTNDKEIEAYFRSSGDSLFMPICICRNSCLLKNWNV